MIFDDVKMAKTLIFQGFVELGIELKMGGQGVGTSDMLLLAIEHLF